MVLRSSLSPLSSSTSLENQENPGKTEKNWNIPVAVGVLLP